MKNYLENFIQEVQADGKLYFTLEEVKQKFPADYATALKSSLNRLFKKGKIVSVYKGFYVIITPEYMHQKMIPPELFVDALFKYLNRPYYVGLLSASMYHGAAHQQPQEYFVMIEKPAMRATKIERLRINYIVKSNLNGGATVDKKTSAGYLKVSTPEQTAVDLIEFQSRIGGLNRASTIIYELAEEMKPETLEQVLPHCKSTAAIQRFGYIVDTVIQRKELAEVVKNHLLKKKMFRVPLNSKKSKTGFRVNSEWKIVENTDIEIDF